MPPRKALLNSTETIVFEAIDGLVAAHQHLARLDGYPEIKVVLDTHFDKSNVAVVSGVVRVWLNDNVAVVSGGGSGHEPAMSSFVGHGMLAAAVCGDVFASPSEDAVLAAIRAVTGPAGCLLIVMSYTGDRLNFGAAAERAKAEGLQVEMVVTADDCAIASKLPVGRRGIAGTVLVHKVAGAAAAAGVSLAEVKAAAEAAAANIGTMGASLSDVTVFGQEPSGRLGDDELELGLGIHGEPGAHREKIRALDGIVDELVEKIRTAGSYLPVSQGDRVALLVNNLGGTTALELHAAAFAASKLLQGQLVRLYCGSYMTSLDMHGLSITIMRLPDDQMLGLLDAPTEAPSWPSTPAKYWANKQPLPVPTGASDEAFGAQNYSTADSGLSQALEGVAQRCIDAACQALAAAEAELNALDAKVGDGDTGTTLARGAAAVKQLLPALPQDPATAALALAATMGRSMGGTSGAVYKILFTAIGASLKQRQPHDTLSLGAVASALLDGTAAVSRYGGAQLGNRTMLDALLPAAEALKAAAGQPRAVAAAAAAAAAASGVEATRSMAAAAGRSSYVPAEMQAGTPDPGAQAVAIWLAAVARTL